MQESAIVPRLGRSVTATGKTIGVVYAMHKALDFTIYEVQWCT